MASEEVRIVKYKKDVEGMEIVTSTFTAPPGYYLSFEIDNDGAMVITQKKGTNEARTDSA